MTLILVLEARPRRTTPRDSFLITALTLSRSRSPPKMAPAVCNGGVDCVRALYKEPSNQTSSLLFHKAQVLCALPRCCAAAVPTHRPAAAAAAEGRASAAEATEAAAAAEVEVTTPAQRRAAVARINRLPALGGYILMGQHGHAEATAGGVAASGTGDVVASATNDGQLQEDLEQGSRQPDGPVACRINGLGTVQAPDRLKPSARVGATARGAFGDAVIDPHTLLKKKGGWLARLGSCTYGVLLWLACV